MSEGKFKGSFILLMVVGTTAGGQGTFLYDQQSSTNDTPFPGAGSIIQQGSPGFGQSFTPSLGSVGFIRLKVSDANPTNGLGATLYLNLRSDSIGGAILGSTEPVSLPNGFAGTPNFFFANPVSVSPGVVYYFQPVVQTGDLWYADSYEYNYPGGIGFHQGWGFPGSDMWFREGIVVPEPSASLLLFLGGCALAFVRSVRARKPVSLSREANRT